MLYVKVFIFNPVQENTYVLYNENNECFIIDPGCYYPEEKNELLSYINENNLTPKMLLNTHCHLDHVFGNKFVAETFGLKLHLHESEKNVLQMAPASGLMFNLPFDNYQGGLIILKDGDSIFLGDDELEIIHAPGHSPGSICFYCRKQNFIIGGDVLFNRSIGRTDIPGGDYEILIKSIEDKIFLLPLETKIYSGHGEETTIKDEKKYNPFVGIKA